MYIVPHNKFLECNIMKGESSYRMAELYFGVVWFWFPSVGDTLGG